MSSDLYETLGVKRTASAETIKKAYRKKALEFHPDRRPGDAAASVRFQEVQTAYDVLSDPVRRKTYDETGQYDANAGVDRDLPVVLQFLQNGLLEVLQEYEQRGQNPLKRDLVKDMIERFHGGQKTRSEAMKSFRSGQTTLGEIVKRLKVKEGEVNLLADLARSKRTDLEKAITTLAAEIDYITKAIKILENHSFDWDRPPNRTTSTELTYEALPGDLFTVMRFRMG